MRSCEVESELSCYGGLQERLFTRAPEEEQGVQPDSRRRRRFTAEEPGGRGKKQAEEAAMMPFTCKQEEEGVQVETPAPSL